MDGGQELALEVGDLSHSDISDVLGCEVAKVKSLVFQARTALIERRTARVESAVPLSADQEAQVRNHLTHRYGPGLNIAYGLNPALLGGLRYPPVQRLGQHQGVVDLHLQLLQHVRHGGGFGLRFLSRRP